MLNNYKKSLLLFAVVILAYQIIAVSVFTLQAPAKGDEAHFVEAIKFFGDLDITKVQDYEEVTTPLVYFVYAAWGNIAGFELHNLRLLSLLIAFITFIVLHYLFFICAKEKHYAFWAVLFFMLNPYVFGFNIFIFTDMLTAFFIILFCISVYKNNGLSIFITAALALLCRQYSVFIIAAGGIYYLISFFKKRDNFLLINAGVIAASFLPLLILFLIWNGFAPPAGIMRWAPDQKVLYNLNYMNIYIVMIPFYILPFYLLRWNELIINRKYLLVFLGTGIFYFLYPVTPSAVTLEQTDLTTVGLLHKLIKMVIPFNAVEHIIFYLSYALGLAFIWKVLQDIFYRLSTKQIDFSLLLNFGIVFFILIMPLSYQVWEKYLVIVLPIILLRMMLRFERSKELSLDVSQ
jgi:hypothetical protein